MGPVGEGANRPTYGTGSLIAMVCCVLSVPVVPVTELAFRQLASLLCLKTHGCDRTSLKAFQTNLFAGLIAPAVAAFLNSSQRLINFAKQFSFTITSAQLKTKFGFLGCPIIWVREIGGLVLHVVDGSINLEHELAFPRSQNVVKVLQLIITHVVFAACWLIRFNAVNGAGQQIAP